MIISGLVYMIILIQENTYMIYSSWNRICTKQDEEYVYLHYRPSKGFFWGEDVFATLFLTEHISHDDRLKEYLKQYDYIIEKCDEFLPHHSYMKYHGKIS